MEVIFLQIERTCHVLGEKIIQNNTNICPNKLLNLKTGKKKRILRSSRIHLNGERFRPPSEFLANSKRTIKQCLQNSEVNKVVNQDFYTQSNCPSRPQAAERHSQIHKHSRYAVLRNLWLTSH